VHVAQITKVRIAQNRSQNAERKNAFGRSVLDDRMLLRWEAYGKFLKLMWFRTGAVNMVTDIRVSIKGEDFLN